MGRELFGELRVPFKPRGILREEGPRFALKAELPTQPLLRNETGVKGAGGARGIGAEAYEHPTGSEVMNELGGLPGSFSSWVLDIGGVSQDAADGGWTGGNDAGM